MDPAPKLDRLAQLRAELEADAKLDDLLAREHLTAEQWQAACEFWDVKMAEEAEQRRSVLTNRYNTAFNTKRKLLAAKRKTVEQPPSEQAPQAPPEPAPSAPVVLRAETPAPHMTPSYATPSYAVPSSDSAPYASPSYASPSYASPSYASQLPPRDAAPRPASAPPSYEAAPASGPLAPIGTMVADENAVNALAEALPFLKAARAAVAAGLPIPLPPSSAPPQLAPDPGMTLTLDENAQARSDLLPFLAAARAALAAGLPIPVPPSQAGPGPAQAPASDHGNTIGFDSSSAVLADAMPFLNAYRERYMQQSAAPLQAPPAARRFSLEEFAALTAQIADAPDQIARVRQRWNLDEASHRAESEAWQHECAENPALLSRYAELVKHYRAAYAAGHPR